MLITKAMLIAQPILDEEDEEYEDYESSDPFEHSAEDWEYIRENDFFYKY
ncbi:hypothetical protein [Pseudorhodobacter turbinis]|nr:hypothetical protein [Pseudorhodobacter turbinis]